jgi:iron complex transport system ATP-binding protein
MPLAVSSPRGNWLIEMSSVLRLAQISHWYETRRVLDGVNWEVSPDEHWVIIGENGCGKSTLLQIASLYLHPSQGEVEVLGTILGTADIRKLRSRIGYMAAAFADQLRPALTALEVVYTAKFAALEPWWHEYTTQDHDRAQECLDRMGVGWTTARPWGTLSSGERQRVLLARTLMNDPALVLLDEPTSRLDLRGREDLVAALDQLARASSGAASAIVTHHVEEIPNSATHVLLIRGGHIIASGPISEALTSETLSDCFAMQFNLERRHNGRYVAFAD